MKCVFITEHIIMYVNSSNVTQSVESMLTDWMSDCLLIYKTVISWENISSEIVVWNQKKKKFIKKDFVEITSC